MNFFLKILSVIAFFLIITPVGYILRLFGKDYMSRELDENRKSYWIKHEQP